MPFIDSWLINSQTNCRNNASGFTFCDVGGFFFFSHTKELVNVTRSFTCRFLTFALCSQLFFSYIWLIGFTFCQKLINIFLVKWQTLWLTIVFVCFRTFIPVNSQPTQVIKLWTLTIFNVTFTVSIFNTDNECTTMMTCIKVVKQCCTSITNV